MKKPEKKIVSAVLVGLICTLVSGIFLNTCISGEFPTIRFSIQPLMGVGYWGFPLPWLKQVVYPNAPRQIIWQNLVIDLIIWSAIAYAILEVLSKKQGLLRKTKRKPKRIKKKK